MNSNKIRYYSWVTVGSAFLMTELAANYLKPQIEKINIIIQKDLNYTIDISINLMKSQKIIFLYLSI